MKNAHCLSIIAIVFAATANTRTSEKIPCQNLPEPVRIAVMGRKSKQNTERQCEKIMDEGQTFYELKVTGDSGKMQEIVFQPDGKIFEIEEEGQISEIPPAARAAIENVTSGAEFLKVDIIRRGRTVLYEGEYRRGGVKRKIIVNAQGDKVREL